MSSEDEADAALLPLADRIAEGAIVDLDEERQRAPQHADPGVLKALLDIAAIDAAHRSAERSFNLTQLGAREAPREWAHLTILEKIGEGEFGEVYRAHDSKLQIDVALKLSADYPGRSLDASKVLEEARLLARVRHPNVVRIYGADHKQGRVGLWMDLVQGRTLEELAKTQGFGAGEAINIGIELCRALAAVHSVGVIHGDIKAHNVIRRDGGQIVLVDFGAGRPLATAPRKGGDVVGTPVYLAPEVLNDQPRSAASDIYSLGVLLFHLITNDYPVYASSRAAFIEAHKIGARKRLRDLRPDLSDGFIQVVERATAADPLARFASAGALETALIHLLAPSSGPVGPRGPNWRAWAPIVAAAAVLAIGGVMLWSSLRTAPAATGPTTGPTTGTTTGTTTGATGEPRLVPNAGLSGADVALPAETFEIDAAFHRVLKGGGEERLSSNHRLGVNDEVYLSVRASSPTYLYVVNEDEKGSAYLLFPLPGGDSGNPLPAQTAVRVPKEVNWKVDTVGGKEHFIVFASTEKQPAFEDGFKKLPAPRLGEPPRLPDETLELFRSVGGLVPARPRDKPASHYRDMFPTPLAGPETAARGALWVRQLTVENPGDRR